MSVLIKGMEMPKNCHECVAGYGGCCFVAPTESDGICPDHDKPDWCPLILVPPHGRLIDADAMCSDLATVDPRYEIMIDWCIRVTQSQPTIIPAEEGET